MCRWGCTTTNTTYMCKWCGTRYCRECLKGDFAGNMTEGTHCRVCNQKKCQGNRVEYVPKPKDEDDFKTKLLKRAAEQKSAKAQRSAKGSAKSAKSSKSAKSPRAKSGKKSGKKKKKK